MLCDNFRLERMESDGIRFKEKAKKPKGESAIRPPLMKYLISTYDFLRTSYTAFSDNQQHVQCQDIGKEIPGQPCKNISMSALEPSQQCSSLVQWQGPLTHPLKISHAHTQPWSQRGMRMDDIQANISHLLSLALIHTEVWLPCPCLALQHRMVWVLWGQFTLELMCLDSELISACTCVILTEHVHTCAWEVMATSIRLLRYQ